MLLHNGSITASISVLVKSRISKSGQRLIDICASAQVVDLEGDVIMQSALLNSAAEFIRSGAIDLDHLAEIGERLGVKNPLSYIIGVPLAAYDGGDLQTNVTGLIHEGREKADDFWDSLTAGVPWRASIYGYPHGNGLIKAADYPGHHLVKATGASRYVVTGISWRSLAMTRNPICRSLGIARVIAEDQPMHRAA